MPAKLIVGLGNPGPKYEFSRHNAGFMVVDRFAKEMGLRFLKTKFNGDCARGNYQGQEYFLLKPTTFMNDSGSCVQPFMRYHNIKTEDLLVVYDDMDIELGTIRVRSSGSSGGQNGMLSVSNHLATQDIKRVRIGIGRPLRSYSDSFVVDYVLDAFVPKERLEFEKVLAASTDVLKDFLMKPFELVMSSHNRKIA